MTFPMLKETARRAGKVGIGSLSQSLFFFPHADEEIRLEKDFHAFRQEAQISRKLTSLKSLTLALTD